MQDITSSAENNIHTSWHQLKNKLGIRDVAAAQFILADVEAHLRVRACHLVYNTQLTIFITAHAYQRSSECIPSTSKYQIPRTRIKFGERSFS